MSPLDSPTQERCPWGTRQGLCPCTPRRAVRPFRNPCGDVRQSDLRAGGTLLSRAPVGAICDRPHVSTIPKNAHKRSLLSSAALFLIPPQTSFHPGSNKTPHARPAAPHRAGHRTAPTPACTFPLSPLQKHMRCGGLPPPPSHRAARRTP